MARSRPKNIHDLPSEVLRNILSHVKVEYNVSRYVTTSFSQNLPWELRCYEILWRLEDICNPTKPFSMFEIMRVCKAWSVIVFESIWGWNFERQSVWLIGAKAMRRLEKQHRENWLDLLLTGTGSGM